MKPETRWKKHGKRQRVHKPRKTPIPWLALSILHFNRKLESKADWQRIRALVADRLIAESYPIRERL